MGVNIRNSEGYMDTVPFQALSGIDHEAKAASKPAFRPLVYICAPFSGDIEANKKKAAEFAAKNGVKKIALEMHPGFCVYNPETLMKLRNAVGPMIGANVDPSQDRKSVV